MAESWDMSGKKYVQDFPNLSPTILNSQGIFYNQFEISFVVKIWDSMETANLPMVWNFLTNLGLKMKQIQMNH